MTMGVLVVMTLPAFAVALQALALRVRLRALAKTFAEATLAGEEVLEASPLAFDIGIGGLVRMLKRGGGAHPYRNGVEPTIVAVCHGDVAVALSDVRLLVVGSALVIAAGALHIAALTALR